MNDRLRIRSTAQRQILATTPMADRQRRADAAGAGRSGRDRGARTSGNQ